MFVIVNALHKQHITLKECHKNRPKLEKNTHGVCHKKSRWGDIAYPLYKNIHPLPYNRPPTLILYPWYIPLES